MDISRHYRAQQLADQLGVARGTIWRWVREGRLPKPIKLTPGTSVWKADDVAAALSKIARDTKRQPHA